MFFDSWLGLLRVLAVGTLAWLSTRSAAFSRLVKSEPRLVMHDGRFLSDAMTDERLSEDEELAALRSSGISGPRPGIGVVLETSGDLSVVRDPLVET